LGPAIPSLYCDQIAGTQSEIPSVGLDSGRAEKIGSLDGKRILVGISPLAALRFLARA
jgi:hypothetical protein